MKPFLEILTYVLPIFHFVTAWLHAKGFFGDERIADRLKTPFLGVTLLLHLLYFVIRTNNLHYHPITSIFELMSVLAFSIAFAYFYLETQTKVRGTGYFIPNFSFLFQLLPSFFVRNRVNLRAVLPGNSAAPLFGFTFLTIAMVLGTLRLPRAFENYSNLDLKLARTYL